MLGCVSWWSAAALWPLRATLFECVFRLILCLFGSVSTWRVVLVLLPTLCVRSVDRDLSELRPEWFDDLLLPQFNHGCSRLSLYCCGPAGLSGAKPACCDPGPCYKGVVPAEAPP